MINIDEKILAVVLTISLKDAWEIIRESLWEVVQIIDGGDFREQNSGCLILVVNVWGLQRETVIGSKNDNELVGDVILFVEWGR